MVLKMTNNPFDSEDGYFFALINDEQQYSLWPVSQPVPQGWEIAFGGPKGAARQAVLDWIDETWVDMRPKSLRDKMRENASAL